MQWECQPKNKSESNLSRTVQPVLIGFSNWVGRLGLGFLNLFC